MFVTVKAIVSALLPELIKGSLAWQNRKSHMYNCIRANVRWSGGKCSTENKKKEEAWLSFQELRKEWKLFFNYWTASGREHWKPQYLALWSAGTHIHLGALQEGELNGGTPGETMSVPRTSRRKKPKYLFNCVIWLLTLYLHNIIVHNCVTGFPTVFDLHLYIKITTECVSGIATKCASSWSCWHRQPHQLSSPLKHTWSTLISTHTNNITRTLVEVNDRKTWHFLSIELSLLVQ